MHSCGRGWGAPHSTQNLALGEVRGSLQETHNPELDIIPKIKIRLLTLQHTYTGQEYVKITWTQTHRSLYFACIDATREWVYCSTDTA